MVEDGIKQLWKELSIGGVKGKINPIAWFVMESETILNAVGNEHFKNLDADARNEMLGDSADSFKCLRDYYSNKESNIA